MRLAIDTSGFAYAIVLPDRTPLAGVDWVRSRSDPPVLAMVEALFSRVGAGPDHIEAVLAARGPGSFTGVRIGLSLAAGLAYARHVPLYLADSLPILARRAPDRPATVALRDAGRGEVYAWREGHPMLRRAVAELPAWLPAGVPIVVEPAGRLAAWAPAHAGAEIPRSELRPLSVALADYANWTFDSQKPLRYDEVQALYAQPAAAEERARKAP